MAYLGLSLIESINEVLESVGEPPWGQANHPSHTSVADTTSIARRAEDFIRRETIRSQALGWPENTIVNLKLEAANNDTVPVQGALAGTTTGATDLTYDILALKGSGPDAHRNYGIRGFLLWDADNGTTAFTDGTLVYLTVAKTVADAGDTEANFWPANFENCSPQLKDLIIANAKVIFQRRIMGAMTNDAALQHEWMTADMRTPRNSPVDPPMNLQPTLAPQSSVRPAGYSQRSPQQGPAWPMQKR
ncbi:MAG: hypothetical protein CL902_03335 [Dehalococcoidia bacterium]|nr:hypothetical protein [Dehalococcoidia bacterium]MDP7637192.1 hypothetical protein [Phycisphaerae bacterium]